jgi:hypothetical protein
VIGGPAHDLAINARADFTAKVQPILVGPDGASGDCGGCHAKASGGVGPGFLSPNPDVFTTVISYPGLIGTTCDTSRILTKGAHAGPAFDAADAAVICSWIAEYNTATATSADMSVRPIISPFLPVAGIKSIDLGALDPQFMGATISFSVSITSDNAQITFSDITLKANASTGLHIKTPLFARYAASDTTGKTAIEIDYDYYAYDLRIGPGETASFSPPLTITQYAMGQLVNVEFDTIEASAAGADMAGTVTGCKDLNAFNSIMPYLTSTTMLGLSSGKACSDGACHGQSGGTGGLNLNGIVANNANVCLSVLNNTNLAAPASSNLYVHPTGGSGTHAGGTIAAANDATWLSAVTAFANAEK